MGRRNWAVIATRYRVTRIRFTHLRFQEFALTPHPNGLLSNLLASLDDGMPATGAEVTLATLQDRLGHRSTGALLLILSLPMVLPIPAPGIATAFGVPLALICAQVMFGRRSPWLPRWLAKRGVSRARLQRFIKKAMPLVCRVEKLARPRWEIITQGWALRVAGAMGTAMGVIMALPIPMGNVMPGVAIFLMALGMLGRDGVLILTGFLTGLFSFALIAAGGVAVAALGKEVMAAF